MFNLIAQVAAKRLPLELAGDDLLSAARAVDAMNRLNSFARSPAHYAHHRIKDAIYRMKTRALRMLEEAGAASQRTIYFDAKCPHCDEGTWTNYSGTHSEPCFRCRAKGTQRLHFRETTIGRTIFQDWPLADIVWHTPLFGEYPAAEPAREWKPRTPGQEIGTDELCRLLNIAEPIFATGVPTEYRINIGSADACAFCGTKELPDPVVSFMDCKGAIWCRNMACNACYVHCKSIAMARYGFNEFHKIGHNFPQQLITPNIQAWIERTNAYARRSKWD